MFSERKEKKREKKKGGEEIRTAGGIVRIRVCGPDYVVELAAGFIGIEIECGAGGLEWLLALEEEKKGNERWGVEGKG